MPFHTFDLLAHDTTPLFIHKTDASSPVKIIVVLSVQDDEGLIEGLLKNILKAVKIDIDNEVHIIQVSDISINILDLIKDLKLEKILCFGANPSMLSMNLNPQLYHPMHIADTTFLFAESLSYIEAHKDRKKILWDNLQSIF